MQQYRPSNFRILPTVVKNLLIINGLMFLATTALEKMGINLFHILGLHYFTSQYFLPFQFLTHMFMHGSFMHIFSNMFALWMFGSVLENFWGPKRFLIFYLVCGLGGALMHLGVTAINIHAIGQAVSSYQQHPDFNSFHDLLQKYSYLLDPSDSNANSLIRFHDSWSLVPSDSSMIEQSVHRITSLPELLADVDTVGASGAIFGLLIAFGMLFPNTYVYLYFFVPVKAKYFVIFYALFELYSGFSGSQDGIAHFAHIGGALVGFILVKYWNRKRRTDFF